MTTRTRAQRNGMRRNLQGWVAPVWQVDPEFTNVTIGQPVTVSDGVFYGIPTPTVSYTITVDGVAKTWPYALQIGDDGKQLAVKPRLDNAAGFDEAHILIAVPTSLIAPGQPQGLQVTNVLSDGMTITWSAPTSGGTPSSYTYGYRVSGTPTWTTASTASTTATLTGLTAGTSYDLEVIASNARGDGLAATATRTTAVAGAGYWPTFELGMNVPYDKYSSAMTLFNDRSLALNGSGIWSSYTTLDANGFPSGSFTTTVNTMALSTDVGDWLFQYTATAQRVVTAGGGQGSMNSGSHVWDSGTGKGSFLWTAGSSGMSLQWDGGVTDLHIYPPAYNTGVGVPFWNPQFIRSAQSYSYARVMDLSGLNGYSTNYNTANATFMNPVPWSARPTPATYHLNTQDNRGLPVEWLVDLCNTAGLSGWFNLPAQAAPDFVTNFGTYVANNLAVGKYAIFETVANEAWNTSPGFSIYYRNGIAAFQEVVAAMAPKTSANVYSGFAKWDLRLAGITLTGTVALARFTIPHGVSTGNKIQFQSLAAAYKAAYDTAGSAAVTLTVVDAYTVSYPNTSAAAAEVSGDLLFGAAGFVSLNAASELMTSGMCTQQYQLGYFWTHRAQYDRAVLLRAAFAAAGRPAGDCKIPLMMQTSPYYGGVHKIELFYAATGRGPVNSVFDAVSVGGYLTLQEANLSAGFGLTGTGTTPSGADLPTMTTSVLSQLREFADRVYGAFSYNSLLCYARSVGIEAWIYELGLDTYVAGNDTTAQKDGKQAANGDARIEAIIRDHVWGIQGLGFSKMGWYQCGAGTYRDTGCFNLGNTASQIDPSTDPSLQSPKFKGLMDSKTAPGSAASRPQSWARVTNHVFPCTLSGFDVIGNEPAVPASTWYSLSGANMPVPISNSCYRGPNLNGLTYQFWSETVQTATIEVSGHAISSSTKTLTIEVLGMNSPHSVSIVGVQGDVNTAVVLGTAVVTFRQGWNDVFVSGGTLAGYIFPHQVRAY